MRITKPTSQGTGSRRLTTTDETTAGQEKKKRNQHSNLFQSPLRGTNTLPPIFLFKTTEPMLFSVSLRGANTPYNFPFPNAIDLHPRGTDSIRCITQVSIYHLEFKKGFGALCDESFLLWERQVLRSRAESQRIAVWGLLYRLQYPGRYLSRLQTDWLTLGIASIALIRQWDPCCDDS